MAIMFTNSVGYRYAIDAKAVKHNIKFKINGNIIMEYRVNDNGYISVYDENGNEFNVHPMMVDTDEGFWFESHESIADWIRFNVCLSILKLDDTSNYQDIPIEEIE